MGQGKSPQTQIGCRVGDSTKHELDGFNQLMDKDVSEASTMSAIHRGLVAQQYLSGMRVNHLAISVPVKVIDLNAVIASLWLRSSALNLLTFLQWDLLKLHTLLVVHIVMCCLVSMVLHLLLQNEWLREEHCRCANKNDQKEHYA